MHHKFDFYIAAEPLFHGFNQEYQIFKFCNAIIGSAPQHPLVKDLLVNLKANHLAYFDTNILQRTGPSYLTRMISQYELRGAHEQRNMYFPCTLFYPFGIRERHEYLDAPEKVLEMFPETAAIHYWTTSWQRPQKKRPPKEIYGTYESEGAYQKIQGYENPYSYGEAYEYGDPYNYYTGAYEVEDTYGYEGVYE